MFLAICRRLDHVYGKASVCVLTSLIDEMKIEIFPTVSCKQFCLSLHFALSLCLWWVQKAMFQVTKRCTEQENLKAMPGRV